MAEERKGEWREAQTLTIYKNVTPHTHFSFSERCLKNRSLARFSASRAKCRIEADYPAVLWISSTFYVLRESPLVMPVPVMVGLLFIRYDPCRHGLVEEDIDSKASYLHNCLSLLGFVVSYFRNNVQQSGWAQLLGLN